MKGIVSKHTWGANVCRRVWLRKERGIDYRLTEEEEAEMRQVPLADIQAQLSEDDVIAAYDRGEEVYSLSIVLNS